MKMKISNQYNYAYQQKKPKAQAFKGYFACPIKELHVQADWTEKMYPLIKELQEKCGKYFDIRTQLRDRIAETTSLKADALGRIEEARGRGVWGQDNKLFLENGEMLFLNHPTSTVAINLSELLEIKGNFTMENIVGGNCFLGKKDNGESFALIGQNTSFSESGHYREKSLKELGIKDENLYVIPQPDFHIDMAIRPLSYPYVLVGDLTLTEKVVHSKSQKNFLKEMNSAKVKHNKSRKYTSADETAASLEQYGLKPIRVPGIFGKDKVNFMNAIVHQNTDGSLIYITNKTHVKSGGIDYEGLFKKYLKKHVPQIKEVIFIDGDGFVHQNITKYSGGIHCMTSERPDFEKWAKMLQKNKTT